ncbi:MAG: RNase adapter RapZ [Clostridia bacterium]|nr:RNase adapter RapZ [Clostridia bacterium]
MKIVIVTGMSGAGKSSAMKCLEDFGYYCIDNMPPVLIPKFVEISMGAGGSIDRVALVTDIRSRSLFKDLIATLDEMENGEHECEVLFLDASDDVLIKRYKETRRAHPLCPDGKIIDGVNKERELMASVRERASHIIDTTKMLTRELREELSHIFVAGGSYEGLILDVMSFGYKYGIPNDADLVLDVRFLPNPFYVTELKPLTGLTADVQEFVLKHEQTQIFLDKITDLLEYLIPYYKQEGKNQLVIAIGCTGGKHRSVTLTEVMSKRLKAMGHRVLTHHRDIDKDSK